MQIERKDIRSILIVEDDESVSAALSAAIGSQGFKGIVAPDVPQALRHLKSRVFAAMILDLRLGDDRAEDLLTRLQIAEVSIPPTIIISARPNEELRLVGRAIQAVAWLKKPMSVENVVAAVDIAVGSVATAPRRERSDAAGD